MTLPPIPQPRRLLKLVLVRVARLTLVDDDAAVSPATAVDRRVDQVFDHPVATLRRIAVLETLLLAALALAFGVATVASGGQVAPGAVLATALSYPGVVLAVVLAGVAAGTAGWAAAQVVLDIEGVAE